MTNAEYFKEEFAAICPERTFCDFIKEHVLPVFNTECEGLFCEDCQKMLAIWTAMEYKNPELNPGDLIWVKNHEKEEWRAALFIKYDSCNEICSCFLNQYINDSSTQLRWKHYRTFTKKEKEMLGKQVNPHTHRGTWIKVRNFEKDPWMVRQFICISNDLKTAVNEPNSSQMIYYAESALLTSKDYYKMQLS